MEHWGPVISALLTLILALLTLQWNDQRNFNRSITEKVDGKMDKADCKQEQEHCNRGTSWTVFDRHTHTYLPSDASVVRRP